jgi:hypothetical protein
MRLDPQQSETKFPASVEHIPMLLVRALERGRMHVTAHFKQRSKERDFNTVDAERIIRSGSMKGLPVYCTRFRNWRISVIGDSCGRTLEIRLGLSVELDLDSPVVALITGIPKRREVPCRMKKPVPTRRL